MDAKSLEISIFLDGCDAIFDNAKNDLIAGFTSNPSLMLKAGITDYETFAKQVLSEIKDKPVSFEVLSDNFIDMNKQALKIASWGKNAVVKIPITNTKGQSSIELIANLVSEGVTLNITAITTIGQVVPLLPIMHNAKQGYISIFCGRIADTGVDPVDIMRKVIYLGDNECRHIKFIWASAREIYNVVQADNAGCHIITINSDLLKKLPLLGKGLAEMSLDTVRMFFKDGSNFKL